MGRIFVAVILAGSIVFHAFCVRFAMPQFSNQDFPTRFDRLKGELQTKKFRDVKGHSVLCWGDAEHWQVEDGKLFANL